MNKTAPYNLEERTAVFGENVIMFCKSIPRDVISTPLISQLVRAATSVGANYMEANGASSRKDFKNKIHICKKEAQETKHWLRMFAKHSPDKRDEIKVLWNEAQGLSMIFGKIVGTMNGKD